MLEHWNTSSFSAGMSKLLLCLIHLPTKALFKHNTYNVYTLNLFIEDRLGHAILSTVARLSTSSEARNVLALKESLFWYLGKCPL